jgi:hypothetical protein
VVDPLVGRAYALTESLDLVSLDLRDGSPTHLAAFTRSAPMDPNLAYEFTLAVVPGRLYVYFADTGELVALDVGS